VHGAIRRQDEDMPFAERITAAELLQALELQRAVTAIRPVSPDTPPEPLGPVEAEPAETLDEHNNITAIDLKSRRDRTHEDR
jgi:hypothetical protein